MRAQTVSLKRYSNNAAADIGARRWDNLFSGWPVLATSTEPNLRGKPQSNPTAPYVVVHNGLGIVPCKYATGC
jgi:hypothetical protein